MNRSIVIALATLAMAVCVSTAAVAERPGIDIGSLAPGPFDAITDVAGVLVGQVTKIEGAAGPLVPGHGPVRTGVTVVLPNDDPRGPNASPRRPSTSTGTAR